MGWLYDGKLSNENIKKEEKINKGQIIEKDLIFKIKNISEASKEIKETSKKSWFI